MAVCTSGKVRLQAMYMSGHCKKQRDGKWTVGVAAQERGWALRSQFVLRGQQHEDILNDTLGTEAVQGGLCAPNNI
jgi:hypothetical protein